MRLKLASLILCLSPFTLIMGELHPPSRASTPTPPPAPPPWFTGPLLCPSAHCIPNGHVNYEPYLYWTNTNASYNGEWHRHSRPHSFDQLLIQPSFQCGFPKFEFDFAPQAVWNHAIHSTAWRLSDMPVSFNFQLLNDSPGTRQPAIKLKLSANVPLGHYQKLNPQKHGTDVSGTGWIAPGLGLIFNRLFYFTGLHYLNVRWYFAYNFSLPIHVKGINAYGGAPDTRGKAFPGNNFTSIIGLEFSLTQRWALATDIQYVHINKNRFSGFPGTGVGGKPATMTAPSSEQFSIAPAIEYNWSMNIGAIAGAWFTLGGRNTSGFVSGVIAVNIYH